MGDTGKSFQQDNKTLEKSLCLKFSKKNLFLFLVCLLRVCACAIMMMIMMTASALQWNEIVAPLRVATVVDFGKNINANRAHSCVLSEAEQTEPPAPTRDPSFSHRLICVFSFYTKWN